MEDKQFQRRRTKSLKKKETLEKHGTYSKKHLRLREELLKNKQNDIETK
jgi:hypothetical protein